MLRNILEQRMLRQWQGCKVSLLIALCAEMNARLETEIQKGPYICLRYGYTDSSWHQEVGSSH